MGFYFFYCNNNTFSLGGSMTSGLTGFGGSTSGYGIGIHTFLLLGRMTNLFLVPNRMYYSFVCGGFKLSPIDTGS